VCLDNTTRRVVTPEAFIHENTNRYCLLLRRLFCLFIQRVTLAERKIAGQHDFFSVCRGAVARSALRPVEGRDVGEAYITSQDGRGFPLYLETTIRKGTRCLARTFRPQREPQVDNRRASITNCLVYSRHLVPITWCETTGGKGH
jgi:hypothetical protein